MRVTYRVWDTEWAEDGWTVDRPAGASVRVDDEGGERVLEFSVQDPNLAKDLSGVIGVLLRDKTGDEIGAVADHLHCLARRRAVEEVRGHDPGCARDHHPDAFCNPETGD